MKFSQILCFFILKCWVLYLYQFINLLGFNEFHVCTKFANDSLDFGIPCSCENCSRFYWTSAVQSYQFFARPPNFLPIIFLLRRKSTNRETGQISQPSQNKRDCTFPVFRKCFCINKSKNKRLLAPK